MSIKTDKIRFVFVSFLTESPSVMQIIFLGSLIYYAGMMLVRKGRTLESGGSVLQF